MAPRNPYPKPKTKWHRNTWEIYWNWGGRRYSIYPGFYKPEHKHKVDSLCRRISLILAEDAPEFPEELADFKAVKDYMANRFSLSPAGGSLDVDDWIASYCHEIEGKNTAGWVRDSNTLLTNLRNTFGGLDKVTAKHAAGYMAEIARIKQPGTHNRNLTVFKKFYSWLVNTKRHTKNPFRAIKRLNEGKETPIVYCTAAERDEIIVLAWASGWPDWLAIVIAFYTGMRREEIANLKWEDVRFDSGIINVMKSKTKVSRVVPMNVTLEHVLEAEDEKAGYVVQCPEGCTRVWRLNSLAEKVQKLKRRRMIDSWKIRKPMPSRSETYRKEKAAYKKLLAKRQGEIDTALERIGWNAFRHTFASLLVQNSVDIDTISSWMGNTPEVCRRHYAQFIPRDRRDKRIDNI